VADKKGVHAQPPPEREGWRITRVGDDAWQAVRTEELNVWQLAYGCRTTVRAGSLGELELYLVAETIKDSIIDMAARLAEGMQDAAARRRAEITGA
jgi:hypothetical protein